MRPSAGKAAPVRTPVRGSAGRTVSGRTVILPSRPGSRSGQRKPWVGRSYGHLALPVPHLDDVHRDLLDRAVCGDGSWTVVNAEGDSEPGLPVLRRQWRHASGDSLLLVVLGWYPLVLTVGAEGAASLKVRRAERRLVEAALAAGGLTVPDAELERVLTQCCERWEKAVAARRVLDEQRTWLECRFCRTCGAWSAYGVLHCRGCARRFAPADDAERDERGRAATEVSAAAERELASLGCGEGVFPDWPAAPPAEAAEAASRPHGTVVTAS
ncbi:hypothetical protein [Actinopolymorpha alba]|uniref:hypothetical protein n=1 Tax=Actinopolymorpha alba TaxID=533267 RepID=UPI0003A30991|nr:hypothetical protein [Actinopolymorpha alba]